MAAPPKTDSYAWQASAQVLTDPHLWRSITAFQTGLPLPLFDFWVTHKSTNQNVKFDHIYQLVELVVKHGTVEMLDVMATVRYYDRYSTADGCESVQFCDLVYNSIIANRVDMLEWAIVHDVRFGSLREVWETAICYYQPGDLRVLDLLRTHKRIATKRLRAFIDAVDDVALAQWLDLYFPGALDDLGLQDSIRGAARNGSVALVKYLLETHSATDFGEWPCRLACDSSQLDVLRYLVEEQPKHVSHGVVKDAIRNRKKAVVEVLRGYAGFDGIAREVAEAYMSYGASSDLLGLVEDGVFPKDHRFSIDTAAENGNLQLIKSLTEMNMATATTEAMDKAAENRKWDVVRYLHEHRSEGCTTRVMDAAAQQRNLEYVIYFRSHRTEGCSTRTMD